MRECRLLILLISLKLMVSATPNVNGPHSGAQCECPSVLACPGATSTISINQCYLGTQIVSGTVDVLTRNQCTLIDCPNPTQYVTEFEAACGGWPQRTCTLAITDGGVLFGQDPCGIINAGYQFSYLCDDVEPPVTSCKTSQIAIGSNGAVDTTITSEPNSLVTITDVFYNAGSLGTSTYVTSEGDFAIPASVAGLTCADLAEVATVTVEAADSSELVSFQTCTLTVVDEIPPVATCTSDIYLSIEFDGSTTDGTTGDRVVTTSEVFVEATDNCYVDELEDFHDMTDISSLYPFRCVNHAEEHTLTFTVQDTPFNNTASCTTVVHIDDYIEPIVSCHETTFFIEDYNYPESTTLTFVTEEDEPAVGGIPVTQTRKLDSLVREDIWIDTVDNCPTSTDLDGGFPLGFPATCGDIGTYVATLSTSDTPASLTDTCTAEVEIRDDTDPIITCQALTVSLTEAATSQSFVVDPHVATWTDTCLTPSLTTPTRVAFGCADAAIGFSDQVVSVRDPHGNSDTDTCKVVIVDVVPPEVECHQSVTVQMGIVLETVSLKVTDVYTVVDDNCEIEDGDIFFQNGETVYTRDDIGETFTVTLRVDTDTDAPVDCVTHVTPIDYSLTCPSDLQFTMPTRAQLGNILDFPAIPLRVTAIDTLGDRSDIISYTATINNRPPTLTLPAALGCDFVGVNTVVARATSKADPTAFEECAFEVTVTDTEVPVATCVENGEGFFSIGLVDSTFILDGDDITAVRTDNCPVTSFFYRTTSTAQNEQTQLTFDCADIGKTIMVNMRVSDPANQESSTVCAVKVFDATPVSARCSNDDGTPRVIQADGDEITLDSLRAAGIIAQDNCGQAIPSISAFVTGSRRSASVPFTGAGVYDLRLDLLDGNGNVVSNTPCRVVVNFECAVPCEPTGDCQLAFCESDQCTIQDRQFYVRCTSSQGVGECVGAPGFSPQCVITTDTEFRSKEFRINIPTHIDDVTDSKQILDAISKAVADIMNNAAPSLRIPSSSVRVRSSDTLVVDGRYYGFVANLKDIAAVRTVNAELIRQQDAEAIDPLLTARLTGIAGIEAPTTFVCVDPRNGELGNQCAAANCNTEVSECIAPGVCACLSQFVQQTVRECIAASCAIPSVDLLPRNAIGWDCGTATFTHNSFCPLICAEGFERVLPGAPNAVGVFCSFGRLDTSAIPLCEPLDSITQREVGCEVPSATGSLQPTCPSGFVLGSLISARWGAPRQSNTCNAAGPNVVGCCCNQGNADGFVAATSALNPVWEANCTNKVVCNIQIPTGGGAGLGLDDVCPAVTKGLYVDYNCVAKRCSIAAARTLLPPGGLAFDCNLGDATLANNGARCPLVCQNNFLPQDIENTGVRCNRGTWDPTSFNKCIQDRTIPKRHSACQGSTLETTCGPGYQLGALRKASWGARRLANPCDTAGCNIGEVGSNGAFVTATAEFQSYWNDNCKDELSCTFSVTANAGLGLADPCVGIDKQFVVEYDCVAMPCRASTLGQLLPTNGGRFLCENFVPHGERCELVCKAGFVKNPDIVGPTCEFGAFNPLTLPECVPDTVGSTIEGCEVLSSDEGRLVASCGEGQDIGGLTSANWGSFRTNPRCGISCDPDTDRTGNGRFIDATAALRPFWNQNCVGQRTCSFQIRSDGGAGLGLQDPCGSTVAKMLTVNFQCKERSCAVSALTPDLIPASAVKFNCGTTTIRQGSRCELVCEDPLVKVPNVLGPRCTDGSIDTTTIPACVNPTIVSQSVKGCEVFGRTGNVPILCAAGYQISTLKVATWGAPSTDNSCFVGATGSSCCCDPFNLAAPTDGAFIDVTSSVNAFWTDNCLGNTNCVIPIGTVVGLVNPCGTVPKTLAVDFECGAQSCSADDLTVPTNGQRWDCGTVAHGDRCELLCADGFVKYPAVPGVRCTFGQFEEGLTFECIPRTISGGGTGCQVAGMPNLVEFDCPVPERYVIGPLSAASWGASANNPCGLDTCAASADANNAQLQQYWENNCRGNTVCNITLAALGTGGFGFADSCLGVEKQLTVNYACIAKPADPCNSEEARLQCGENTRCLCVEDCSSFVCACIAGRYETATQTVSRSTGEVISDSDPNGVIQTFCADIDECLSDVCQTSSTGRTCINRPGSFVCTCLPNPNTSTAEGRVDSTGSAAPTAIVSCVNLPSGDTSRLRCAPTTVQLPRAIDCEVSVNDAQGNPTQISGSSLVFPNIDNNPSATVRIINRPGRSVFATRFPFRIASLSGAQSHNLRVEIQLGANSNVLVPHVDGTQVFAQPLLLTWLNTAIPCGQSAGNPTSVCASGSQRDDNALCVCTFGSGLACETGVCSTSLQSLCSSEVTLRGGTADIADCDTFTGVILAADETDMTCSNPTQDCAIQIGDFRPSRADTPSGVKWVNFDQIQATITNLETEGGVSGDTIIELANGATVIIGTVITRSGTRLFFFIRILVNAKKFITSQQQNPPVTVQGNIEVGTSGTLIYDVATLVTATTVTIGANAVLQFTGGVTLRDGSIFMGDQSALNILNEAAVLGDSCSGSGVISVTDTTLTTEDNANQRTCTTSIGKTSGSNATVRLGGCGEMGPTVIQDGELVLDHSCQNGREFNTNPTTNPASSLIIAGTTTLRIQNYNPAAPPIVVIGTFTLLGTLNIVLDSVELGQTPPSAGTTLTLITYGSLVRGAASSSPIFSVGSALQGVPTLASNGLTIAVQSTSGVTPPATPPQPVIAPTGPSPSPPPPVPTTGGGGGTTQPTAPVAVTGTQPTATTTNPPTSTTAASTSEDDGSGAGIFIVAIGVPVVAILICVIAGIVIACYLSRSGTPQNGGYEAEKDPWGEDYYPTRYTEPESRTYQHPTHYNTPVRSGSATPRPPSPRAYY